MFSREGEVVWHAEMGGKGRALVGSLRTFKRGWRGRGEMGGPRGWAYSWGCGAPSVLYASWNGATEVVGWRFYGGNMEVGGEWALLGVVERDGFETVFRAGGFVRWVVVEAVGVEGEVLGRSGVFGVWVPEVVDARACGPERCPETLDRYMMDMSGRCFEDDERYLAGAEEQVAMGYRDAVQE